MTQGPTIVELAAACAARVPLSPDSFHHDRDHFARELESLLAAVQSAAADRFAFDRDGRPAAIAAIRSALPSMERDLLDAVLEDVACELAATQEALYRVVAAARIR